MEVITIKNSILQSCTYILATELSNDVYLVDCGDVPPIKEYIIKNNKNIKGIFLTHSHYDHIYGLNEIIALFPDIIIYAHEETIRGIQDPDINLSYMYDEGDYIVENFLYKYINNKEDIELPFFTIRPISTPGHDLDCMSYLVEDYIFTGDSYNPDFEVFTKWRRGNAEIAKNNENYLKNMISKDNLKVYPGHYR